MLAPGVLPRHALCYLFAALMSIGLYTYLVALTPYILTVNLGLPKSAHGQISGDLQFWQEILLLSTIGLWGAISDRFGRRLTYSIGFLVLFAGYAVYAFATTPTELILYRLVFALGLAATTTNLVAVIADYAEEGSRGKMTGIAFFLNGIGSVLFFVFLTRLPDVYASGGATEIWAGRYAFLTIAALAFIAALVMLGLKPGRPDQTSAQTPVLKLMTEGITAARNIRISLSYVSAFTARADMAIVTLFLTLWVVQAATSSEETAAQATARAGMIVGTAQMAAVVWAPIFGIIADRIDRLTLLVLAFLIATIGYGWVASVDDILAASSVPALLILGAGLSSCQLATTVLLAQEAPARIRGSAFGVQAFCGGLGILTLSAGGGRLFDSLGPHAPFVAVAIANGVVLAAAAACRLAELRQPPPLPGDSKPAEVKN